MATGNNKFFKQNKSQELFHKIEWIEGDLLDVTFLPTALKEVKTIFHTAANVSFDEKNAEEIIKINVIGTENLVNEAIASNVKEFIYVSSIAAMDDLNPVTKLIDEKSTWNNELKHSTYAISKYRGEMEVWRGSQVKVPATYGCSPLLPLLRNWVCGTVLHYLYRKLWLNDCGWLNNPYSQRYLPCAKR